MVTDALEMGALGVHVRPRQEATVGFLAGSDLLLMPSDPYAAVDAMVEAIRSKRVSRARLTASVTRMLTIKAAGVVRPPHRQSRRKLGEVVGRRSSRDSAYAVSARSLVLVRDSLGLVDSLRAGPRRVAMVSYADGNTPQVVGATLQAELTKRGYQVSSFRLTTASGPASYDSAAPC